MRLGGQQAVPRDGPRPVGSTVLALWARRSSPCGLGPRENRSWGGVNTMLVASNQKTPIRAALHTRRARLMETP
jgi:hypothetical protein